MLRRIGRRRAASVVGHRHDLLDGCERQTSRGGNGSRSNSSCSQNDGCLEQFQQKCVAVLRLELRENKEIEHFRDSEKTETLQRDFDL
ncbi:hypothetical protein EHI44_33265 [Rhizobium leguminosarum]|nr:hypothetical protein EHI44_33265 [Rhizobium leguminosarum]